MNRITIKNAKRSLTNLNLNTNNDLQSRNEGVLTPQPLSYDEINIGVHNDHIKYQSVEDRVPENFNVRIPSLNKKGSLFEKFCKSRGIKMKQSKKVQKRCRKIPYPDLLIPPSSHPVSPKNKDLNLPHDSRYIQQAKEYKFQPQLQSNLSDESETTEEDLEEVNVTKFELIRPNYDYFIAKNLEEGKSLEKTRKEMNKMEIARKKYSRWYLDPYIRVGSKCSSPDLLKAQSRGNYKLSNLQSNKKSSYSRISSPKISRSKKNVIESISESYHLSQESPTSDEFSSKITSLQSLRNPKSLRARKLEQVEVRGRVKELMKENGLNQLDHLARNEFIIKMIKQKNFDNLYKKESAPEQIIPYQKNDSGLKNYIEDFEKQLLRIETNPRGLFRRKVDKSKIKRFLLKSQ